MILGTVWLKNLGPTLWDFNRRTLQFWRVGKVIILQGVSSKGIDLVKGKFLMKLLQTKGVAYAVQVIEDEGEEATEPYLTDLQGVLKKYQKCLTLLADCHQSENAITRFLW